MQSTAIDFSDGVEEADGTLCVFRAEERDSVEQEQEQQCTRRIGFVQMLKHLLNISDCNLQHELISDEPVLAILSSGHTL